MGTLAIDIETASPFKSPESQEDFRDTEYFELFAVALGYQPSPERAVETEVLFRNGDWETESTWDLLRRVFGWCEGRSFNRLLTYNGEDFDAIHLRNWAGEVEHQGIESDTKEKMESLLSYHVDVATLAQKRLDGHGFPKFEEACQQVGIDPTPTYYSEYGIDRGLIEGTEIGGDQVEGWHIGEVWGEKYIRWLEAGLDDRKSFEELHRLITDYAIEDVRPLIELDRVLASETTEV